MALEVANVEQMMAWFAADSPVRSEYVEVETLVEQLAALVFQGEAYWPDRTDRVDVYRDGLLSRLADDGSVENEFAGLTTPDADPGVFINWLARVVAEWESRAADDEAGAVPEDDVIGYRNPTGDGTPGTEYYRIDEGTGEYVYSAAADGPDWATYEQRRYTEPARNDDYGLDCRYDRRDGAYEWYDEGSGTWRDQEWAEQYAADPMGPDPDEEPEEPSAAWDENWRMFYRTRPDGEYEYADAVTPGEESSGSGDRWLSHREVLQRREVMAQQVDSLQTRMLTATGLAFQELPDLQQLGEDDIKALLQEVADELAATTRPE